MKFNELIKGKIYKFYYADTYYQFLGFDKDTDDASFIEVEFDSLGKYRYPETNVIYFLNKFDALDLIEFEQQ